MNKAASGFFALTEITDSSKHVAYNWWHASDHQPENLALDGTVYAARWAAPKAVAEARLGAHPALTSKQYLGHYMMREPVDRAIEDFSALSRRTKETGRSFPNRSIVTFGHHRLMKAYAADRVVCSPEALPWRPHTGVFCTIKQLRDASLDDEISRWHDEVHVPDMLDVPGVAGCYWFRNEGQAAASIPGSRDRGPTRPPRPTPRLALLSRRQPRRSHGRGPTAAPRVARRGSRLRFRLAPRPHPRRPLRGHPPGGQLRSAGALGGRSAP